MSGRRPDLRILIALSVLAVLIAATNLFWLNDRSGRQVAESNASEVAGDTKDACERSNDVARELGDTCRKAEEIADEPAEPVDAGPSDKKVDTAVADLIDEALVRFCADNPNACEGDDAPRVSDTQLAAIVAAYCAGDACTGRPGDDAPALSNEQIASGVATYCADNDCFPEDGVPGRNGESAYQIWLNAGNTGTEADFLASLEGDKGDTGDASTVPGPEGGEGPRGISVTGVDLLCDNPDRPIWRTHFSDGSFEDEPLPRPFCNQGGLLP